MFLFRDNRNQSFYLTLDKYHFKRENPEAEVNKKILADSFMRMLGYCEKLAMLEAAIAYNDTAVAATEVDGLDRSDGLDMSDEPERADAATQTNKPKPPSVPKLTSRQKIKDRESVPTPTNHLTL